MIFKIQKIGGFNYQITIQDSITWEKDCAFYDINNDIFYLSDDGRELSSLGNNEVAFIKETCAKMKSRWEMMTNGNN